MDEEYCRFCDGEEGCDELYLIEDPWGGTHGHMCAVCAEGRQGND
jgi:hypothetical protein